MICTQISNGVHNPNLKEKLWESDLDLEAVVKKCNFLEQSEDIKELTGAETNVHAASDFL